jgi:hypothetical protein
MHKCHVFLTVVEKIVFRMENQRIEALYSYMVEFSLILN